MSESSPNPFADELQELTRQVCEGTIDEASRDRLELLLSEHSELREAYLDYLDVNARLIWRYRTGPSAGPSDGPSAGPPDGASTRFDPADAGKATPRDRAASDAVGWLKHPRRSALGALFAATAAALGFLLLSPMWRGQPPTAVAVSDDSTASAARSSDFIATIRESTALVRRDGADPLEVGGRVAAGELRLGQGRAELILDSGVRLVVEGPADIALASADEAFLRTGKVAVFVPEHAIGFRLLTPTSTLIDQGTEFGVVAEETGATEVHVFRGQVDLVYADAADGSDELKRLALLDRQARRVVGRDSLGEGVDFAPERFRGLADRIAEPVAWPAVDGGNGHFYQLLVYERPVTWQEAAVDAFNRHHRGMPGHLATITTDSEHRFVVERLLSRSDAPGVWIGLTDVLRESYFRWITGEPYEYERWATAHIPQPDNFIERAGHGGEDYGMYTNLAGEPWAWNDLSNDSIHQTVSVSLIEYEPVAKEGQRRSIVTEPYGWTRELGGEGQHYRLVLSLDPLSWEATRRRAEETSLFGVPGRLATFETEAERDFVVDKILKVCGVAENLIGLATDSTAGELRWITGAPLELTPHTTPNIPAEEVYGQMRWLDGAWRLQTVSSEKQPAGWFGYLVEYPAPSQEEGRAAPTN